MPSYLSSECPHCRKKTGLEVVAVSPSQETFRDIDVHAYAHARCLCCYRPSSALLERTSHATTAAEIAELSSPLKAGWAIVKVWPEAPLPDIPGHLPESVQEMLTEAETAFSFENDLTRTSAMAFGKALELAIKQFPEATGHNLADKIRSLGASGRITPDLAEWVQTLRLVRNDAMHDAGPINRADLEQFRSAVQMILRYLFTLPGMLADIKSRRHSRHAS